MNADYKWAKQCKADAKKEVRGSSGVGLRHYRRPRASIHRPKAAFRVLHAGMYTIS